MVNILLAAMPVLGIVIIVILAVVLLLPLMLMFKCYKKCPNDKAIVVYGNMGKNADGTIRDSKCVYGRAVFVMPSIQTFQYLDLNPINVKVNLKKVNTSDKNEIDFRANFSVAITKNEKLLQIAGKCFKGCSVSDIKKLAEELFIDNAKNIISKTTFAEIKENKDKFLKKVVTEIEPEMNKLGLIIKNYDSIQ